MLLGFRHWIAHYSPPIYYDLLSTMPQKQSNHPLQDFCLSGIAPPSCFPRPIADAMSLSAVWPYCRLRTDSSRIFRHFYRSHLAAVDTVLWPCLHNNSAVHCAFQVPVSAFVFLPFLLQVPFSPYRLAAFHPLPQPPKCRCTSESAR